MLIVNLASHQYCCAWATVTLNTEGKEFDLITLKVLLLPLFKKKIRLTS